MVSDAEPIETPTVQLLPQPVACLSFQHKAWSGHMCSLKAAQSPSTVSKCVAHVQCWPSELLQHQCVWARPRQPGSCGCSQQQRVWALTATATALADLITTCLGSLLCAVRLCRVYQPQVLAHSTGSCWQGVAFVVGKHRTSQGCEMHVAQIEFHCHMSCPGLACNLVDPCCSMVVVVVRC
jgi:hypothetical protein